MAANKMHIKANDTVVVLAGKDKGQTGKVVKALPAQSRVIVEGLNVVKRHTRPTQANPQGGIVEKEMSLDASNVMLVCGACSKPARTGIRTLEDGSRVRFCKKCNEIVDK